MIHAALVLAVFPSASAPFQQGEVPDPGRFERVVLHQGFDRPMELAVLPDGRVLVIELAGVVWLWRPADGALVEAGRIPVFPEQENGLLGVALDPGFLENGWVYLLKSPPQFPGQELARFTLVGDRLDPDSEVVLFAFAEQREQCCHHAGSLEFGPGGELFVATGDNTHPHGDSGGYAPLDEREGRAAWNASNTSADPFSANGKVLRLRPLADGSYAIPEGNLFPPDGSAGLPEIYVMGCRNPWRIAVDPRDGVLYWGDVGPDAGEDGPRGPRGYDEVNRAAGPGNFGWPFLISTNLPYRRFDHATGELGAPFDPAGPRNDSALLPEVRVLPPAQPAWISYPYGASEAFPELDAPGGRTACAGPVYVFDPALESNVKFPAWFDDTVLIYEWSRNWIQVVHEEADGAIRSITPLPGGFGFTRPVDLEYGPEGALYVLEYGETWGTNPDSRLVRLEYWSGNRPPRARITARTTVGAAPFEARLSAASSVDRDGDALAFSWQLLPPEGVEAEPTPLGEGAILEHTFARPGVFVVELEARDTSGATHVTATALRVGNAPPEIEFLAPASGAFVGPDESLRWQVRVRDGEDGDSEDPEDDDPAWWMREVFVSAQRLDGVDGEALAPDPPGLVAMRSSDCLGCHAVERRVVGPAFREVAARYRGEAGALAASLARVREGSSGVWGTTPMRAHPGVDAGALREMVAWVLALPGPDEGPAEGDAGAVQGVGVVGRLDVAALGEERAGVVVLEASYRDTGSPPEVLAGAAQGESAADPVGPLEARARVVLRLPRIEAEDAAALERTRVLESSSASGGAFLGAIDHGARADLGSVRLERVDGFRVRVSSAGGGGTVELWAERGVGEGTQLTSFVVAPNGAWEEWFELEQGLPGSVRDALAGEPVRLVVRFRNEAQPSALMNLDRVDVLLAP